MFYILEHIYNLKTKLISKQMDIEEMPVKGMMLNWPYLKANIYPCWVPQLLSAKDRHQNLKLIGTYSCLPAT